MEPEPTLQYVTRGGLRVLTDPGAGRAGVHVAFTDRNGGVSAAPFDTLNLALRSNDDRSAVLENRARAAGAAGFQLDRLVLSRQLHGTDLIEARAQDAGVVGDADGLIARAHGIVLGILAADCGAVVLAGRDGIAVVHAGWRGLAAGVVGKGVAQLGGVASAWVGPCIKACCYRVGPEVVEAFEGAGLPVGDERHVDIEDAAGVALRVAGVERIAGTGICTHCDPSYFSYRRDGITGRQGAFVWTDAA